MKRLLDVVLSGAALVLLAPVMIGTALAVRITLGPPILFRQIRPGKGGVPFELVKFRTMHVEGEGGRTHDGARLTRVGKFLRATSLDELPELWNVFRGDMSLVGPRPLLMEYLPLYDKHQLRRHEVKPGMTGWAQVNGRNAISWQQKFNLDVWYVDNCSLFLDMRILWLTFWKVLKREGISSSGHVTGERFRGNI